MLHIKRFGLAFLLLLQPFYARSSEVSKSNATTQIKEKIIAASNVGKTLDGKTSPLLIFRLSTRSQREKLGLGKIGGGGVVDGGGGNVLNGSLFDIHQAQGLKELSTEAILTLLNLHWGKAIKRWENEAPGISEWLRESLSLPWYLDSKNISPKKCLYLSTQQVPICYNGTSVLIQEKSFESLGEAQKALHILTASFIYHYAQRSFSPQPVDLLNVSQAIAKLLPQSNDSTISLYQLQQSTKVL